MNRCVRPLFSSRCLAALFAALFVVLAAATSVVQAQSLSTLTGSSQPAEQADSGAAAKQPSLDDLIKILENDDTRKKLIESLKAAAYKAPEQSAQQPQQQAEQAKNPGQIVRSLPGRVAEYSRMAIGAVVESVSEIPHYINLSTQMLSGAESIDLPNIFKAILPVALVAFVVFAMLFVGRYFSRKIFRKLADGTEHAGPLRKLSYLVISALVELVAVVLSWACGYLIATLYSGTRPIFSQALFLNAFLLIEMIKVVLSAFVAPNYPELRLTPFSNRQASYWYFWISRLISIIGYTFLFIAPIVQWASTQAAAEATQFIVAFGALCLTIGLILKNRGVVRERLKRARKNGDTSFRARAHAFIGQIWWLLAIVATLSLFVVWLQSPEDGLAFVATAAGKSVAAMALGGLLFSILSRMIAHGVIIPQELKYRLPLLERRLNGFVPKLLTMISLLVVAVVFVIILDSWGISTVGSWFSSTFGQQVVSGFLGALLIVMIACAIYLGVSSWIEYRLNPNYGTVPTARERTLLSLFRNAFTITLVVVITMLVLSQIGIDIAPLLAGAGVVGLAIGFGAQKLVQDIITGAFIQIQNAMNEGDVVELNGVSGVVEQLTVRSVGLRSVDGTWHLIPFSAVDRVANFSKDFAYYVADIGVAYRENVEDVKAMMIDAFEELKTTNVGENLISGFDMWGVNELGDSAVVVRGRVMTKPGTQWGVGRAYREIIKRMADERGIEIPFPHMTVWFGEDRNGKAPPVRMREEPAEPAKIVDHTAETKEGHEGYDRDLSKHGTSDGGGKPIPPDAVDIDTAGGGRG
ncbi:mechanosensitive ion channel [Jiella sp. MQZ9-1]|uniref:Mechanosensitive ion channel n=1 Tax=Jiella flava TaxID=2816857 RepID=A0A939JUQ6_9HYPH|nr:mechanosensitive ion channel domain-containing protein [Jiella flava]MBO0663425.1 mechanosensitive ion channel [Jiella flava]MCD2472001.1 mechanosensitive ion channel [Jiella flava]